MPLSVKAFYLRDWRGEPKQIRRFSVDDDVAASFTYLVHKLASVFRLNRACSVRWKGKLSAGSVRALSYLWRTSRLSSERCSPAKLVRGLRSR